VTEDLLQLRKWPREIDEQEGMVLYSLRNYQTIEMVLKAYLSRATGSPDDPAPYPLEKVANLPLVRLLKRFKAVNANAELQALLDQVVPDRNRIAHQALLALDPNLAQLMGAAPLSLLELRAMDSRALKAMTLLVCEYARTEPKA
jgi:hypothetical protein